VKNEYGFLFATPSTRISIEELVARDEGAGPFVWVRPQDVIGIDASKILAGNLKSRKSLNSYFDDEDISPEASVCSYLESCVRHRPEHSEITVDDVVGACVYIMVKWGSSLPAHGFYGDLDLISSGNASRILKILRTVYDGLSTEVLRQNIRYFVGEHYQTNGVWALNGVPRFSDVLDSEDLECISKMNLDEINSNLNFRDG